VVSLQEFTVDLLSYRGALVEPDGLGASVVAEPWLSRALGMPEYQRLVFDPASGERNAALVHYDSPIFEAMGGVVELMGRLAFTTVSVPPLRSIDATAALARSLTVQNGIARLRGVEEAVSVYVAFVVEYELLADERTGGLLEVCVNPTTRSIVRWSDSLLDGTELNDTPAPDGLAATAARAWTLAAPAASAAALERTREFRESLARRRDRDLRRLRDYYQAIDGEIRRKIARLAEGHDVEAERRRLDATERSYRMRAADLVERSRLRVRLTPLAALACALPTHRLHVELTRRRASTSVSFSWNPIDRGIEPRCCDGCERATLVALLCDERVHYLCSACFGPCSSCGKLFCRACHGRCPRGHE